MTLTAVGLGAAITLGIPLLLVLRWRRWLGARVFALLGFAIGLAVFAVVDDSVTFNFRGVLVCGTSASAAAAVFRKIGAWASSPSS